MPRKNSNPNPNPNPNTNPNSPRGGGGRGRGRGRGGGGRGRGRGGGFNNAHAQLASELDMMNDFIVAPPSPGPHTGPTSGSGSGFRGGSRGGGGGRGQGGYQRGRGRGGFGSNDDAHRPGTEGGRGRGARGGRGRGSYAGRGRGGGGTGAGSSMLQDDLHVLGMQFSSSDQANHQTDYTSTLFPQRGGGSRRGGRGRSPTRARGAPHPTSSLPPRRRSSGIGATDSSSPQTAPRNNPKNSNSNSNYKPVDPFGGPLSSLLYRERPLLRPITFVPSVHTRILFSCDDEDEGHEVGAKEGREGREDGGVVVHVDDVDTVDGGVGLDGGDDEMKEEFSAHAPTADRVMRVFMGSPVPSSPSSSSSSSSSDDDDDDDRGGDGDEDEDGMETIDEIDFNDLSKLIEPSPKNPKTKSKSKNKKTKVSTTKLWMERPTGEESFMGLKATPSESRSQSATVGEAQDQIVDDMYVDDQAEAAIVEVAPTALEEVGFKVPGAVHETGEGAGVPPSVIVGGVHEECAIVQAPDAPGEEEVEGVEEVEEGDGEEGESELEIIVDPIPTPAFILDTQPSFPVNTEPSSFVIDTQPSSFVIDTEPISSTHTHAHEKPRIRTPPPIKMDEGDDEDDEVIVYVAPHPRRGELEVEGDTTHQSKPKGLSQHTFTPYQGIRGTTTSSSVQATSSNSVQAMEASSTTTSTTFPSLGTPRLAKRLSAPPLSTPRMAKQALAKQKRVLKREKEAERRRKGRSGLFDKKRSKGRGSFGAMGAWMQERELRDEYGSGSDDDDGDGVDKRRRERRRGDSDLEWGTEDEDGGGDEKKKKKKKKVRGEDEDEYMTLPELQRVLMESSTAATAAAAGKPDGGDDAEAGFVPFTPTAASKRRERRRKSGANANAGAAAQRRKDDTIAAALDMDVDSDLDPEAMKRFIGGMLGRDSGVHVSAGDLEDESRMRDEDDDDDVGGLGESGDESESESEDEDEEEEKEIEKVVDVEEELMIAEDLMAEMSVEDDEDDDDDDDEDDDEERTPTSKFKAKLEKIRESSLKPKSKSTAKAKGKGKAKDDSDDDDFDDDMDFDEDEEDEFFNQNMKWAAEDDEEDLIDALQDLLDQDEGLLTSRERRSRNRLFKAISNGEFEYLEDDFSFPAAKRGKKAKRDLIPPELRAQWDKDRQAKAERKQQRELEKLLRAGDPFAPKKGGKKGRKAMLAAARLDPTITVIPNRIIDMSTLVQMLHKFVDDLGGKQTLSLPPTNKETRKNVHELALAFNLKSISKGKGDSRYVTVSKTTRTAPGRVDDRKVARIMKKCGGPGARGNEFMSGSNPYKGGGGKAQVPKHKEGEIVGKAAPKIGATNVGFKMLAMMGWSEGERIGVGGLEAPIEAVIKHSKLGLGAMK